MNIILEFVKNYFIFLLLLLLFSYLAPKKEYRKYLHFFISALMIAVLLKPIFTFLSKDARMETRQQLEEIYGQLEEQQYQEKGEDVFEWFWEHEGLDYSQIKGEE